MTKTRVAAAILAVLIWMIIVPVAFVSLYSTIELQNVARAVSKADPRLAMLRTTWLARQLDAAEDRHGRVSDLKLQLGTGLVHLFSQRSAVRASAVDILLAHRIPDASHACTAPPDVEKQCQVQKDRVACQIDWEKITACYDRAVILEQGKASPALAALAGTMATARTQGFAYNELAQRFKEEDGVESDPLLAVADALRGAFPNAVVRTLFAMPQGVIVACFTSIMAAIGAGVGALLKPARAAADGEPIIGGFLTPPILGALTGFMVYFVVSAGTAVLIQPAPSDSSQPISNLSAPALASLGVLAGLSAEQALLWLQEKGKAFFRS